MNIEEREKRDEEIIILSETKTQKQIGEIYNLSPNTIGQILRKHNIKRKNSRVNMSRLSLDIDYFKNIDNCKKAYWLGYITADGCVQKTRAKLTICCKDLELIEKFKKDINSGHKITPLSRYDKRTNKTYQEYCFQVGNELFVKNIINNGIDEHKTDICEFPKIKEDFIPYFVAGLFDGDGSVSIKRNNTVVCNLISTKEILDYINDYLFENFQIKPCKKIRVTENKPNVYKQYWYKNSIKFLDFIYCGDKEIYLSRKYERYIKYKEIKTTK